MGGKGFWLTPSTFASEEKKKKDKLQWDDKRELAVLLGESE